MAVPAHTALIDHVHVQKAADEGYELEREGDRSS